MARSHLDPTSICDEISQFCAAANVKHEADENSYSSAAQLYAKQVTPNVLIDITGKDTIIMKTEPDRENIILNRRVAYENVPKKTGEILRQPMKPLIHRCVGRIFAPSERRRNKLKALLRKQAADLVRQLDEDSDGTEYANERETESIERMEQDLENELPAIIDSTQADSPVLNSDIMFIQEPVMIVAEPDLPLSQPTVQNYCHYCQRSFSSKLGLSKHTKRTKMHADNVLKWQIEQAMAANNQNGV